MELQRVLSVLLLVASTASLGCAVISREVPPPIDLDYCEDLVLNRTSDLLKDDPSGEGCSGGNLTADSDNILRLAVMVPLLNQSVNEWQYGEELQETALIAQWLINRCSPLKDKVRVDTKYFDSGCNRRTTAEALADVLREDPSVNFAGIVGPGCSSGASDVARLVQFLDLGMISYGAEDNELSDRSKYPLFFRTSFKGDFFAYAWLELMKIFNWNKVAVVSAEERSAGRYAAGLFQNLYKGQRGTVVFEYNQLKDAFDVSHVIDSLVERKARIVLVMTPPSAALKLLCAAYRRKLTGCQGHNSPFVWIVYSWLLDYTIPESLNVMVGGRISHCSKKELRKACKGLLSIQSLYFANNWMDHLTGGKSSSAGESSWQRDLFYNVTSDEKCNISTQARATTGYTAFMYDAVWAWAYAFASVRNSLQKMNKTVSSLSVNNLRKELVQALGNISFPGLSGQISFNGADRSQMIGEVVNIFDDLMSVRAIGTITWEDGKVKFESTQYPMIWGESCPTYSLTDREGFIPPDSEIMDGDNGNMCRRDCLAAITIGTVVLVLGVSFIAALVWKHRYKKKIRRRFSTGSHFCPGGEISTEFDTKYEIPRDCIVQGIKLGEGAFGEVFQAEAVHLGDSGKIVQVAMKVLKSTAASQQKFKFISEANVMKRFQHENVMQLLGVCSQEEPFVVIMELMPYGDLKSFLSKRRHLLDSEFKERLSSPVLTRMAQNVAEGLRYLDGLRYVHRDLAARNCMVGEDYTVKIGDFGMAEDIYSTDYFRLRKDAAEALPVRWMAPEAIRDGIFTVASDVWSFGVVVWEVMMFGTLPYGGWSNAQVIEGVLSGKQTPERPHCCPPLVHELFDMCWAYEPSQRSTPSGLANFIGQYPNLVEPCVLGDGSLPAHPKESKSTILEPIVANRFTSVSDDSDPPLKILAIQNTGKSSLQMSPVFDEENSNGSVMEDDLLNDINVEEVFTADC